MMGRGWERGGGGGWGERGADRDGGSWESGGGVDGGGGRTGASEGGEESVVRRGWRGGLRVGRVINFSAPCPSLPTFVWLETCARLRDKEGGAPMTTPPRNVSCTITPETKS